jgi:hypothetical protein
MSCVKHNTLCCLPAYQDGIYNYLFILWGGLLTYTNTIGHVVLSGKLPPGALVYILIILPIFYSLTQ